MSFKEITLKEIGKETSFGRTSIYNYFQTKEEIFLAILKREYDLWSEQVNEATKAKETMTNDEIAHTLASTLEKRPQLLKILSMNHYDLEQNSRMEQLTDFKVSYKKTLEAVNALLSKFREDMDEEEREQFIYSFFPFMFGIYPYTVITEKQKQSMRMAGVEFKQCSLYELTFDAAKRMLNSKEK